VTPDAQAVTDASEVVSFNTQQPLSASISTFSGITVGQTIVSIDRRPQNGLLYGLGYAPATGVIQLYLLSLRGGVATAIGTTGIFVDGAGDPARVGSDASSKIGMDFNPSVDRIRVVTNTGQNFRINPNTGAFVDGDLGGGSGSVAGLNMDGPINGGTITLGETAYTNNQPSTIASPPTTQYTLDAATDSLFIQVPPNAGTQTSGQLLDVNGVDLNIIEVRGFDIPEGVNAATSNSPVTTGQGFAVLEFASNSQQLFSTVDLTNGAVSSASQLGGTSDDILGLAVQSAASRAFVALTSAGELLRFRENALGTTGSSTVSGLAAGETLCGIDFRPSTGQLYGFGIDDATQTGTLYVLDPRSASATVVGSASSVAFVDSTGAPVAFADESTGCGMNFNPATDRVRIVSQGSITFQINPSTGAPVDGSSTDAGTNPDGQTNIGGTPANATKTSYTNSFGGAAQTTQYALDAMQDRLVFYTLPNNGTQVVVGGITIGGVPLDFDGVAAFEIPSTVTTASSNTAVASGTGYAVLREGGDQKLYTIDLTTGAATLVGATAVDTIVGIAVGEVVAQ
jgi:hypothetical protein